MQRGTQLEIADRYEVGIQSIRTHMDKHVGQEDMVQIYALEREKSAKNIVQSDRTDVVATLQKLSHEAEQFLERAKTDNDIRAGITVIGELRKQIELTARVLGTLSENGSTMILAQHPQFIEVRNIILDVLEQHPEAKADFLQRLGSKAIGHEERPKDGRGSAIYENRKKRWPTR
jgi:hypothetical protein